VGGEVRIVECWGSAECGVMSAEWGREEENREVRIEN